MRKILSLAILLCAFAASSYAQSVEFQTKEIDYGTINQGDNGEREFVFTNTGDAPVIITNAQGSCGCTVPQWDHNPIAPGNSSVIKVKYDTQRIGAFSKTVTLTTNCPDAQQVVLSIKGLVVTKSTD